MNILLLAAMAYLGWGMGVLIRAGFVGIFNRARAETLSNTKGKAHQCFLLIFIIIAMVWCWLTWPLILALYQRDRINQREEV